MAEIATGSAEESLDIVQDAMLKMVQRYREKPEEEWKPLFYCIVQNLIRDWYRRNTRRKQWYEYLTVWKDRGSDSGEDPMESLPGSPKQNPEEQALMGETKREIDRALKALPLRQQQVFLLRAWGEQSVAETARAMKCTQGSVKTHYSRALQNLRRKLEGYWP